MRSAFNDQRTEQKSAILDISSCRDDVHSLETKVEHLSTTVNLKQIIDVIPDNGIFTKSQKTSKLMSEKGQNGTNRESRSPKRDSTKIKHEEGEKVRHRYGSGSRSRSPRRPKMEGFKGDKSEKVEQFLYQFDRVVKRRRWSSAHSASRLLDLLGGVALEFADRLPLPVLSSYEQMSEHLVQRFSLKVNPRTARKELSSIKQVEGETIEDFSQKVSSMAMDGYKTMDQHSLTELSVEAFLRGLSDKQAARHVLEKNPTNMCQALQLVKEYQANNKAIFGTTTVKSFQQRNVTFSGETNIDETLKQSLNNFLETNFKKLSLSEPNQNPGVDTYPIQSPSSRYRQNSPSRPQLQLTI